MILYDVDDFEGELVTVSPTPEIDVYVPPYVENTPIPDYYSFPDTKGFDLQEGGEDYTGQVIDYYLSTEDENQWLNNQPVPNNSTENYLYFISHQLVEIKAFIILFFVSFLFFKMKSWFSRML